MDSSTCFVMHRRNPVLAPTYIGYSTEFTLSSSNSKIDMIIDTLKTLNLLEASELVKKIEETFGVDSSAYLASAPTLTAESSDHVENIEEEDDQEIVKAQTEFNVSLTAIDPAKRMQMLRILKDMYPDKNLKEVKEMMDSLPLVLAEKAKKEDADSLKTKIEEAGGTLEIT